MRQANPHNPPCPDCGRTLSVETDFYWICHTCNKKLPRGIKKVRPPGPEFKVLWLCSSAHDEDPYRAGQYYDVSIIRADMRQCWLHPGTVFVTPEGKRVEVRVKYDKIHDV